jgi:hypothetical protein
MQNSFSRTTNVSLTTLLVTVELEENDLPPMLWGVSYNRTHKPIGVILLLNFVCIGLTSL